MDLREFIKSSWDKKRSPYVFRKKFLDPRINIIKVDTHINTPDFAQAVVNALKESLER